MSAHLRTLLTVICEAALEKKLLADLDQLGAPGWTISDARGRGGRGVRSAGWDTDGNIRVEIICARDVAERLAAHLQAKYYANFAMVCYLAQVEVLLPEKFWAAHRVARLFRVVRVGISGRRQASSKHRPTLLRALPRTRTCKRC